MSRNLKKLSISGARENNLKNIETTIAHDQLTVITGLSGSGKSSLAFDTIYAEGQRRYIETFSPYTRQFFDKVKKPDVDSIQNVRPAVAIQQRTRVTNSRSTVGSMTNVNDYLKVLWANIAQPVCTTCGIALQRYRAKELADLLARWVDVKSQRSFLVCAALSLQPTGRDLSSPPVKKKVQTSRRKKKVATPSASELSIPKTIEELAAIGFSRVLNPSDGSIVPLEECTDLPTFPQSKVLLVLDRVKSGAKISSEAKKRLQESIEQAYQLGVHRFASGARGLELCCIVEFFPKSSTPRSLCRILNGPIQTTLAPLPYRLHEFAPIYRCEEGTLRISPPRPSLFSFNHPIGACPECKGFGKILTVDPSLCVPNPTLSIADKAIQCWAGKGARIEFKELLRFCEAEGIATNIPWNELPHDQREKVFTAKTKEYWGVQHWFKWLERKAYKMHVRVFLSRYRNQTTCPQCNGTRLKPEALMYQVMGKSLPDLWNMPIDRLIQYVSHVREHRALENELTRPLAEIFDALLSRLRFLDQLGLSYLTLERQARTLSGGETQRVNLATALGSELISTEFVLDEPSVGLHARDTSRLINAVHALSRRGNSVLVVEHDLDFIDSADEIIELGPHAGAEGGQIIFQGPLQEWKGIEVTIPQRSPKPSSKKETTASLRVQHAVARNLKNLSLEIPLRSFVCVTGVSGSGKSTLVHEVIVKAFNRFHLGVIEPELQNIVHGFENIAQVLVIDQSPLSKTPRANIATYSGIWDAVRNLLASTDDAHARALSKSAFSFNVDGGRCPACKGAGYIREDMQFLSDVFVPCELCLGKRFQQSVLEVRFKGRDVSQLLVMDIEECHRFFHDVPAITGPSQILCELGLGHLTLGHPLSELSGGEAQRLKLVPVIDASQNGQNTKGSLLIFDEPTTGLHQYDVQRLIALFHRLSVQGHSVLCVEHNLSLIAAADWIIDLGPEGGDAGGMLLGVGTPQNFCEEPLSSHSPTGSYLRKFVNEHRGNKKKRVSSHSRTITCGDNTALQIRGARENNLKNLSIDIPLSTFVAITGVSGSGKSTLAKDIIYAEGQRRYLDCLSPYARQFIKELKKPEIDDIRNVTPTVCVYQHTFQPSRLSTVATMSEIYNFLRLLYAKTGIQHCPDHPSERITPLSPDDIARSIRALPDKSVRVLAPVIKLKKGTHRAVLERAVTSEISQVRVDGVFLSPSSVSMGGGLDKNKPHTIEYVVGRFNPSQVDIAAMSEMVSQALSLGAGTLIVHREKDEIIFSTERTCPICKRGFFKPDPEDLSFNSSRGRCAHCEGTGSVAAPKSRSAGGKEHTRACPECQGARIGPLGRNLRLQGRAIHELCALKAPELQQFIEALDSSYEARNTSALTQPIIRELAAKIDTLLAVGLEYLELSRECATLSGGELQRLRLATAMSSTLSGAMYIFDEPSAGLHPLDNVKVLERIRTLLARDNSILMIEHDSDSIKSADYVVDIGPGGGKHGGSIVYQGNLAQFLSTSQSTTALCLRNELSRATSFTRSSIESLNIKNAHCNNISDLSLRVPLKSLVVVAGVSGAGKSSFVHGIIGKIVCPDGKPQTSWHEGQTSITSTCPIERVLEVDQKPIGINSRSTPASYLKIFDHIRELFSSSLEARARGWKPGFFSYNSGAGRCPECKGLGMVRLEMNFLPDAAVQCETCQGLRYGDEALSVKYLGLTIAEALKLTFEEAKSIFANHRSVHHTLRLACELGLSYLTLGQSSASLSGGESQRIKLVSELAAPRRGHTLYLLDEPTTGLHKADVSRLMLTLSELVQRGNSVLIIEHDSDVLLAADHIIEFGPHAGSAGGKVVFEGPPEKLQHAKTNWGQVLHSHHPEWSSCSIQESRKSLK